MTASSARPLAASVTSTGTMNKDHNRTYNPLFYEYYEACEIKPEFEKEFISLWPGWLGPDNYHKLDEVAEYEQERFKVLIGHIAKNYNLLLVNIDKQTVAVIDDIEKTLVGYTESRSKGSSEFFQFIIPELDCLLTEEWDYTFIIWYKNKNVIEKLKPFIKESKLFHFSK
jgi:hypothetical protein